MKKAVLMVLTLLTISIIAKEIVAEEFVNKKQIKCDENYEEGIEALNEGKYGKAIQKLTDIRLECIGGIESLDSLYFRIGEAYRNSKKYSEGHLEYRMVVEDYPNSPLREKSMYYMGACSFNGAPPSEMDTKYIRRSMRELNRFIAEFPNSGFTDSATVIIDSIYERLADKKIKNAKYYDIVEKYESSVIYYQIILDEFPTSKRIDEVYFKMAKALVNLNRFEEAEEYLAKIDSTNEKYRKDLEKLNILMKKKISEIEKRNK